MRSNISTNTFIHVRIKRFNRLVFFDILYCKALQSHIELHVNEISICLYLSLQSLEECVFWPWHVQAGCMFPSQCALTSAHELETLLLSSLSLSFPRSLSHDRSGFLAAYTHNAHWQQIPGRINARLNWINIIQTCSIPACLSWRTYTGIPDSISEDGAQTNAKIRCQLKGRCWIKDYSQLLW